MCEKRYELNDDDGDDDGNGDLDVVVTDCFHMHVGVSEFVEAIPFKIYITSIGWMQNTIHLVLLCRPA